MCLSINASCDSRPRGEAFDDLALRHEFDRIEALLGEVSKRSKMNRMVLSGAGVLVA